MLVTKLLAFFRADPPILGSKNTGGVFWIMVDGEKKIAYIIYTSLTTYNKM